MFIDISSSKPLFVYETTTDPLVTNMYLSLAVKRGSWWFNKEFGIRKDLITKISTNSKDIVRDVILEAFQWMIDAGKVRYFSIITELDISDSTRINLDIKAEKTNGDIVKFATFMSVV